MASSGRLAAMFFMRNQTCRLPKPAVGQRSSDAPNRSGAGDHHVRHRHIDVLRRGLTFACPLLWPCSPLTF